MSRFWNTLSRNRDSAHCCMSKKLSSMYPRGTFVNSTWVHSAPALTQFEQRCPATPPLSPENIKDNAVECTLVSLTFDCRMSVIYLFRSSKCSQLLRRLQRSQLPGVLRRFEALPEVVALAIARTFLWKCEEEDDL